MYLFNKIRSQDPSNNAASIFLTPNSLDIICGRGKAFHNHPGNQKFRAVILLHLPKYSDSKISRKHKTQLVQEIVEELYKEGARFLKQEKDVFYDIGFNKAKQKVGHALRDATVEMRRSISRAERSFATTSCNSDISFFPRDSHNGDSFASASCNSDIAIFQEFRNMDNTAVTSSCNSDSFVNLKSSSSLGKDDSFCIMHNEHTEFQGTGDLTTFQTSMQDGVPSDNLQQDDEDGEFSVILDMLQTASIVQKKSAP